MPGAGPETIFALSSAPGRAGLAVVRISGPEASKVHALLGPGSAFPPPRRAQLRRLTGPDGGILDEALVLFFAAPHSFTGENVVELHLHGGRATVGAVLSVLSEISGFRPAEAGEFTRRAVENGKFDFTRAEALADLISAETEGQRRQAIRQYEGALEVLCESWRGEVVHALAWAEAAIDFGDEELPDDLLAKVRHGAGQIAGAIAGHLADHRGELVREGIELTLIGAPNSGKSSLLNALAKRDVAIVSDIPGTTRDIISVRLDLGGYPVTVSDTAGLRTPSEAIEAEGVSRALRQARDSDLVLLLLDGTSPEPYAGLTEEIVARADFVVWNKCDLPWPKLHDGISISAMTGTGLQELLNLIVRKIRQEIESKSDTPLITRERHRHHLEKCRTALLDAQQAQAPELVAEHMRIGARELGRITGRVDVEDLLDVIFRDFCIGK